MNVPDYPFLSLPQQNQEKITNRFATFGFLGTESRLAWNLAFFACAKCTQPPSNNVQLGDKVHMKMSLPPWRWLFWCSHCAGSLALFQLLLLWPEDSGSQEARLFSWLFGRVGSKTVSSRPDEFSQMWASTWFFWRRLCYPRSQFSHSVHIFPTSFPTSGVVQVMNKENTVATIVKGGEISM